jgi:hypothetical protein
VPKKTIVGPKFGGENTKYFHAKAIKRYRFNSLSEIKNEEGELFGGAS